MTDKPKRGVGRPTKKSDTRVEILLDCLTRAMPIEIACNYAQIDYKTYFNWKHSDPDFSLKVEYAQAQAVKRLVGAVETKDPWKILKNTAPAHFKEQVEVKLTEDHVEIDAGTEGEVV